MPRFGKTGLTGRLAAAALAAAACCALPLSGCRPAPQPDSSHALCRNCNVLLISADTLRADHVGAYGYQRPTTPNIDALAGRGVLFERAVSQSSWTRPAHLSIMTGLHPAEHGVVALRDRQRLAEDVPTLAGVLETNGYRTAAFTGGVNLAAVFGFDQGFETYRSNGKYFRDNLEDTRYWLQEHKDERFFLFWHGYDPHTPYLTDPVDRLALGLDDRSPRRGLRKACRSRAARHRIQHYVDEYDGAIHRADRYVGKLLALLEELGLRERTLIVFTSDHGEEFFEHGGCFHLNTLYDEVLFVPLIIAAPATGPRRVAALVPASVSIAPTILELVGISGRPLPGPSLAAAVAGEPPGEFEVVSETSRSTDFDRGHGHLRALTRARDKLIHWITLERFDYFDTARDRAERQPRSSGPEVEETKRRLARWVEEHPRREQAPDDAKLGEESKDKALEEQLRSLGYAN